MPPDPAQQRADVYLRKSIKHLNRRLDKAVAEGPGVRGVHATRVAARRLRSVLRHFEDQLPHDAQMLREQLRELAGGFSELRDLDVLLGNLRRWSKRLKRAERDDLAPILVRLEAGREPLVTKAGKALKRWQKSGGRKELEQLTRPELWPKSERLTIGEIGPEMVHDAYVNFDKAVRRARKKPTLERYHKLRIRGKRLRYVLSALSGFIGERAKPALKGLTALQDAFGEYLDAENASQVLGKERRRKGQTAETRAAVDKLIQRCKRYSTKHLRMMPVLLEQLDPKQWEAFMNDIRGGKQ